MKRFLVACAFFAGPHLAAKAADSAEERTQLQEADRLFGMHCASAGEKIAHTVENVDGIFLMKLRRSSVNFDRQFDLDDPYGSDYAGMGYINGFLRASYDVKVLGNPTFPPQRRSAYPRGFQYVEAVDPDDGQRYRYQGRGEEPWQTDKHYLKGYFRFAGERYPATAARPRYGVTYDDISTHEDRGHWIAGSSLKIVDLDTGEVIAERIGYMMDRAQGSRGGGRAPWLIAANNACPRFGTGRGSSDQIGQTTRFVEKVLRPK